MGRPICVFCSSSDTVAPVYTAAAAELGRALAAGGHQLVYGGMDIGLMGVLAQAVRAGGGRVTGIVPEGFAADADVYHGADEIITTSDLRQRKAVMAQMAEAFVVLPGGFGTLDELAEVLSFSSLHLHARPIVIVNTDGFYDPLLDLFERFIRQGFARQRHRHNYHVVAEPAAAMSHLESRFAADA